MLRSGLKCGGLESKFGRGPGPRDRNGMGWSVYAQGSTGHVFRDTQLGYIGSRIAISVRQYDLAMVQHRSKNQKMKDGKLVLIVQPLLESRTSAYLEWLVNEVIMTANKI